MPTIDIIIRNKTASAVNPPCIVCGNSDYNVKFDFDEEWQAHNNKIGVFAYNRCGEWQSEKVLFEGDTCPVPALHGVRSVWIGVTAGDVRTSTPADVPCRMGATDFSDTDEPPSADVWGQILAKLGELQTEIDEIKQSGGAEVYYAELDGEYPSYTLSADTPLADIAKAYAANKSIVCRCKIGKTAATLPLFIPIPKTNTWIFSGSGALGAQYPSQTFTVAITPFGVEAEQRLIAAQTDLNAVIATVNEAVLYTEQALSNPQKRQARKNIGANGVTITGANEEITPYDNIVYQAIVAELEGVQNITLIYNNDKIKMQYWEHTGVGSYALFFDTAVVSGENIVRKSYEVNIAPSAGTVTEHITPAIKPDEKTDDMTNPVGVDGYGKLWSKADTSLNVTGATVGQTIKVKTVDADGKPTAWEAVDMATGDAEVWEKVCEVTTTEDVSFIYQPLGNYYKKIRAIFLGESTAAGQVWVYPNTETLPGGRDIAYIFNAPYANAGKYTIVGEFSSSPYPAPNSSDNWYRGRCSIAREQRLQCLHAGWGDNLFDNYVGNTYAKDIAQGVKSLLWTHNTGEIKAGAKMVVFGVKA